MPESTILQPLTWNKSTRLCPWKLRQSRAHFVNEFALQQEEAKKNLAFFPQHFHKDINCALKDADRRNLSKLSSRERSALYSLETHKDTSEEFKDCQIFLQLGIRQGTQTSLITRGSEKKKKKKKQLGWRIYGKELDSFPCQGQPNCVSDLPRSRRKEKGRDDFELQLSSWHSGEFQLFPRILNRKKTTYEFYAVKKRQNSTKSTRKISNTQTKKPWFF